MTKNINFNHKTKLFETAIFFQHSNKIKQIIEELNLKRLVILTGIHNSGKTSLTNELVKKIGREKEIFYFDKGFDINNDVKTGKDLQNYFQQEFKKDNKIKIIILKNINKIKNIKDYLNFVYLDSNNFKIIILSNTIKINNCTEVNIFPESVSNIGKYYNLEDNIKFGTFPEVLLLGHDHFKKKHLQLMHNDIFTKDIYNSFGVKNIALYDFFIKYLSRNNKFYSLRELHKCINIHLQISLKTIIDYTNFSQQSRIIYSINPFDFKKNKIISTKSKYYFTDTGMRNSLGLFQLPKNILKENLLAQQLAAYGHDIYTGINGTFEFNFYVKKDNGEICIQLSKLNDKQEIKKEINKLNKIPTTGKKYLILENITQLNMRKFIYDNVEIISYKKLFEKLFFSK